MQTIFYTNESSLAAAFDVPKGVAALIGGGGKTTAMLRLAHELAAGGARVIVTTTTHIFPPDGIATTNPDSVEQAKSALECEKLVCFGSPAENGKLAAPKLPIHTLATLADYVLVEADGAKRLPLKAPAGHEPVIPPEARLVIAVAGLDGIGQSIRDAAFRPKLYAKLCGKAETERVTPRDVALVLSHEAGQRKGVPANARFTVLLNKADDAGRRMSALAVATELGTYDVERAVIAQLEG